MGSVITTHSLMSVKSDAALAHLCHWSQISTGENDVNWLENGSIKISCKSTEGPINNKKMMTKETWKKTCCRANSLRPRQNRRHFADDVFKCNFLNEIVWILIKISLKFVPKGPINNIPALVKIMAWRRTGDKPLSEPVMAQFKDAYMRHSATMS